MVHSDGLVLEEPWAGTIKADPWVYTWVCGIQNIAHPANLGDFAGRQQEHMDRSKTLPPRADMATCHCHASVSAREAGYGQCCYAVSKSVQSEVKRMGVVMVVMMVVVVVVVIAVVQTDDVL